uniref:Uncharacterized protein n=1 Tax=Romanomermis culicivorax TaxID=13658 RepID=A0A915ISR6_ROMCU
MVIDGIVIVDVTEATNVLVVCMVTVGVVVVMEAAEMCVSIAKGSSAEAVVGIDVVVEGADMFIISVSIGAARITAATTIVVIRRFFSTSKRCWQCSRLIKSSVARVK